MNSVPGSQPASRWSNTKDSSLRWWILAVLIPAFTNALVNQSQLLNHYKRFTLPSLGRTAHASKTSTGIGFELDCLKIKLRLTHDPYSVAANKQHTKTQALTVKPSTQTQTVKIEHNTQTPAVRTKENTPTPALSLTKITQAIIWLKAATFGLGMSFAWKGVVLLVLRVLKTRVLSFDWSFGWLEVLSERRSSKRSEERIDRKYSNVPLEVLDDPDLDTDKDIDFMKRLEQYCPEVHKRWFSVNSISYQIPIFLFNYWWFPYLEHFVDPLLDTTHGDFIGSLVDGFLPVVSVLFAILMGFTINTLVDLQNSIREAVNQETSRLLSLTRQMIEISRTAWEKASTPALIEDLAKTEMRALRALLKQTTLLAICSTKDELIAMRRNDPYSAVLSTINKSNDSRAGLAYGFLAECMEARNRRLSAEGERIPPAQFVILVTYALMLLLATTALIMGKTDPNAIFDSRVLFAFMISSFCLVLNFAKELNSPFEGRLRIRRTLVTANLYRTRQLIHEALDECTATFGRKDKLQENAEASIIPSEDHLEPDLN